MRRLPQRSSCWYRNIGQKPKKSKNLKYATHMSIIRSWLLKRYPDAIETFGFVTSENRNHLNLEKDHYIDACVSEWWFRV